MLLVTVDTIIKLPLPTIKTLLKYCLFRVFLFYKHARGTKRYNFLQRNRRLSQVVIKQGFFL